jgi:hypothetical protein
MNAEQNVALNTKIDRTAAAIAVGRAVYARIR